MTTVYNKASYRMQIFGAVSGIIGTQIFFQAQANLAGFFPLLEASLSAEEVKHRFIDHQLRVQLASVIVILSVPLTAAFFATIASQIRRIEGIGATNRYIQLVCGVLAVMAGEVGGIFWAAASYRADRSAELILMLSDLTSLFLIMAVAPACTQLTVIGLAVLSDKARRPIFPRWVGYLNLLTAIVYLPSMFIVLFTSGPFSWNGAVSYWIVSVGVGVWTLSMAVMVIKAARRELAEGLSDKATNGSMADDADALRKN